MKDLTSWKKMIQRAKEAGIKEACKSYIQEMIKDAPEGYLREEREKNLEWRWEYEDNEVSEEPIGGSVGIWFGALGDRRWDQWEYFSITCTSDWDNK
tara:strand:+ start:1230 stop:1520 length:291 start_codon:yes stop_codon:yes gene_type:complete